VTISEQQLETWARRGPTAQFTATYETLRNVLNDTRSPYYPKDYTIFLQGSYKNDTNVYGDSDVDVVIRLNQTSAFCIAWSNCSCCCFSLSADCFALFRAFVTRCW
jgi:Nucleotidyltransferase domain